MSEEIVKIFGKEYPSTRNENCTDYRHVLPDYFALQKHFSAQDYYNEVIKNHPEYKSWFKPSEKQIEKMIIEKIGMADLDGATSVPKCEKTYNVKIAGNYKYPQNMSDIEYNFYTMLKTGLKPIVGIKVTDKASAYWEAWQNLHFPPEEDLKRQQDLYYEIISLNPELEKYIFDINNKKNLEVFLAGITYKFPIDDIMMFINNHETYEEYNKRVDNRLQKLGVHAYWRLSDKTIQELEKQLQGRKVVHDKFVSATEKVKTKEKTKTTLSNLFDKIFDR